MHKLIGLILGLVFSSPFWMIPPIWITGPFTPAGLVAIGLIAFALMIGDFFDDFRRHIDSLYKDE